jgi:Family of unknown function (DUF6600)
MRQQVTRFALLLSALGSGAVTLTGNPGVVRAQSNDEQVVVPVPEDDEYADTDPSALTDFRPTLDPHGSWIDDPNYGTAWTPNQDEVGPDFVPYDTDGQWDYVDGDYSWISDFAWGWVCFHYGRWVYSSSWIWIPGRTYAPAWVDWRLTNDDPTYLGWAPTAPAWGWNGGSAVRLVLNTYAPWTYVGANQVFGSGLSTRLVTGAAAQQLTMQSHAYVRTRPHPPGRLVIQPVMHGPPPALLGIDVARIAHPAHGAREQRARQFARPSTALPLGAHAPAPHVLRASPIRPSSGTPSRGGGIRGRR